MTVAKVTSSLSASTPMDSDEKRRKCYYILSPFPTNVLHPYLSQQHFFTSTSSLYDDRPDLEKGFFDCSSDIQENKNKPQRLRQDDDDDEEDKQEDFSYTPVFLSTISGFGLNGTCMETLLGKDKDGEEDKCSEKSNSGIGSGNGQMKKWFTDTFFARRKEEEDGGESTDDYENSNNRNLNNSSDNGDSTASKGTLDTALVHSVIEEETSSYASSSDQQ